MADQPLETTLPLDRAPLPRGGSVGGAAPLLYLTDPESGQLLRRRWQLSVVSGPDKGRISDLTTWTGLIGAAPAAALMLTDDAVSRYHAEVDLFAEGLRVRDLDSTNGTFVYGDQPARLAFLPPQEVFRIGETTVRVIARDEPVPEPPVDQGPPEQLGAPGHRLLAQAPITRRLFARLRRVAGVKSTVLLVGAAGTGKSVLARALHEESRRRAGPFVRVDLRADPLSQATIESARGGTLFLDHVEGLPRGRQGDLLKLLEDLPVGGRDVRVVACSTRRLGPPLPVDPRLVARLQVVELRIPALATRAADVWPLAQHFMGPAAELLGPRVRAVLEAHDWPGHVAALERVIGKLRTPTAADDGPFMRDLRTAFLTDLMARFEGHVTRAGLALGVGERALYASLAAHDVEL